MKTRNIKKAINFANKAKDKPIYIGYDPIRDTYIVAHELPVNVIPDYVVRDKVVPLNQPALRALTINGVK